MLRQIKLLTKLRFINVFNLNEMRYGKKGNAKMRMFGMAALYLFLILLMMAVIALLAFAFAYMNMGRIVPLMLAVTTSLVVLFFTALKAGPMLFDLRDYEMLSSLPFSSSAIIVSRFLRMYVSNALLSLGVTLPATITCGVIMKAGFAYYPMMIVGSLFLPLIPMTVAMLLGMLVFMVSSRMKRRNLAVTILSALGTILVIAGPMMLDTVDTDAMLGGMISITNTAGKIYPPATWFADAVNNVNILQLLLFIASSVAFFLIVAMLVGRNYFSICARLASRYTARNFRMSRQNSASVGATLLRREFKRLTSTPSYMLNIMSGFAMAVIVPVIMLVAGADAIFSGLASLGGLMGRLMPFLLALFFALTPSTYCCISLEGKQWWMVQTLPISANVLMRSKILLNLLAAAPFWLASGVISVFAVDATAGEAVWLFVIPLAYIVFSTVLGLRINLSMPNLSWENEASVIKQGKSVIYTALVGLAGTLIPGIGGVFLPEGLVVPVFAGFSLLLLVISALMYRSCVRVDLRKLA